MEQLESRALLAILPPSGLASWYRAEGNANDWVGANNGTLVGDTAFAAGKVGRAFTFDGNGDSVQVPDAPTLDPTTQLTLEAWVYPTADSGDGGTAANGPGLAGAILNKEQKAADGSGTTQYEVGRRNNTAYHSNGDIADGDFVFFLGGLTGLPSGDNGWVDANAALPLNTWTHVAITYDGAAVRAYVNGTLTREIAASGTIKVTDGALHVGARDSDLNYGYWAGRIDDPAIFNRALSAAEIQSLYAAGSEGMANLVVTTATGNYDPNDGQLSLFEALAAANDTIGDRDVIGFDILGSGVHSILVTPNQGGYLPEVTDPVVIDGYTEAGSSPNTNSLALGIDALGINANPSIEITTNDSNSTYGLNISAGSSMVRGLAINRFGTGIILSTLGNNAIEGNFIGTDVTGTIDRGNGNGIKIMSGDGNRIGTNADGVNDSAERNLIAGNDTAEINIQAGVGTQVLGNFIGTKASGAAAVFNVFPAEDGVFVATSAATNAVIGGTAVGSGNLISGVHDGIESRAANTTIQGNFIGPDRTGTFTVGNTGRGVNLDQAANATVGGVTTAARNLMSGNKINGISAAGAISGLVIQGNYIGTDITGMSALTMNGGGINVSASGGVLVGGTTPGAENVVSGNGGGIAVVGTGIVVQGNLIGTAADGITRIGNGTQGVTITGSGHLIGGTVPGAGNTIAYSHDEGVGMDFSNSFSGNAILGNRIFSNGRLGIDLGDNGATPNDVGDADAGPNKQQNFPEISSASVSGGKLHVTYLVSSDPANSVYPLRIEFFKADADGQEGQQFVGFDSYTATDYASGLKAVAINLGTSLTATDKIVATATDGGPTPANTSEFSASLSIPHPWHNDRNPLDVDGDTHVVPRDALLVINYINGFGSGFIPDNAMAGPPFYDTSGDFFIAPNDALLVINYINAHPPGSGEGESVNQPSAVDAALQLGDHTTIDLLLLLVSPSEQRRK